MRESEPIGQMFIRLISNLCFSVFLFSVLIFTVIAITYQPPDPWLESTSALTKFFSKTENPTLEDGNSILKSGEVFRSVPSGSSITEQMIDKAEKKLKNLAVMDDSDCDELRVVNCSDPRVLLAVERFNLKQFKSVLFLEYLTPVNGSKANECDVAWRFRSKRDKSWRKYKDFRRFRFEYGEDCFYRVEHASGWHSGINAKRLLRRRVNGTRSAGNTIVSKAILDDEINDTILSTGSEADFKEGKYLYYKRGGDYCKGMNHFAWSFLCGLGEAMYLKRTFVMDLSMCLAAKYNPSNQDVDGKDFRYYFDFEHLKDVASVVEEGEFLREWKKWDQKHEKKVSVKKVVSYKVKPKNLKKDNSTIIWRQFDAPSPGNFWFMVCDREAAKYIERPWHALLKSKILLNIVAEIGGRMDYEYDAIHVVRGERVKNKKLWPNLDSDTSPGALLEKLEEVVHPWTNLYIATNEPSYNYFDTLRSEYKVHLLDDYRDLWNSTSEWYHWMTRLTRGRPVEFDGYMRAIVDTEVFYRGKIRLETFNNLTKDCKDGVGYC
ncbi:hypothetical protein AB3S75_010786 [Citrus x aurantiifolia]